VLLGRGDGTFISQIRSPAIDHPVSLAPGDFNGDGVTDLAVVSAITDVPHGEPSPGRLFVLTGGGDGAFVVASSTYTGFSPISVVAEDVDGDGALDLAVANWSGGFTEGSVDIPPGEVHLFLGRADGSFADEPLSRDDHPIHLASGDFNGDGQADLVVAASGPGTLSVLTNQGDGTFSPASSLTLGVISDLSVGDFDHDGRLDLAVLADGTAFILAGLGDGTFRLPPVFPLSGELNWVTMGDFNGDGRPDVITSKFYSGELSFLPGLGDGRFGEATPLGAVPCPVSFDSVDMNNDGALDLLVGSACPNAVFVLPGDGLGGFDLQTQGNPFVGIPVSLKVGDFDNNGRVDLAYLNSGAVAILLGLGDGSFGPEVRYPVGPLPYVLAIGDFNNDGSEDLAVANERVLEITVLLGHGNGQFTLLGRYPVGIFPVDLAVGDLDGDGHPDLVIAGGSSSTNSGILWGRQEGAFDPQMSILPTNGPARAVAVADMDSDGHLDVVVKSWSTKAFSVFAGGGDRTFQPERRFLTLVRPGQMFISDVDSDRRPDVVFVESSGDSLAVLLNGSPYYNYPPVAQAGPDQSVECGSREGGSVFLDGSESSDPDSSPGTNDDIKTFGWFENFGAPSQVTLGSRQRLRVTFPVGQHILTLQVVDSQGLTATAQTTVTVVDTTPPSLSLSVSPSMLWPANHRMIPVQVGWQVSDVCDPQPRVVLVSVVSSEPADARDIAGAGVGAPDSQVSLRAQRSGSGPGRVYTLTYVATDASGNTAGAAGLVTVPHEIVSPKETAAATRRPGQGIRRHPPVPWPM
jgi:hypothetical protein